VRSLDEPRLRAAEEAAPPVLSPSQAPAPIAGDLADEMLGEIEPEYDPGPDSELDPDLMMPDPEPLARSGEADFDISPETDGAETGPLAVALAWAQLGKPYQWGAAGPDRFDCSGLVQFVYSNLGVALPRVSRRQASTGVHVDRDDLRPGDLVFFSLSGTRINHVGIYAGKDRFIHAPRRYNPVRLDSLNNSWWRQRFIGGRRVDDASR
jgi:cell wall-associated NlpC family hydrolase